MLRVAMIARTGLKWLSTWLGKTDRLQRVATSQRRPGLGEHRNANDNAVSKSDVDDVIGGFESLLARHADLVTA